MSELIVFSDDWGRHPSSCQHLVRQLLPRHRVWWVNTIGTRLPSLSREDLAKVAGKMRQWVLPGDGQAEALPANLAVLNPKMWPGFRRPWQRRLNARLIANSLRRALPPRTPGSRRVAVTTLPITADLVGRLDVDRWVYYCVDDFSVWPGLDADVMRAMEADLVRRVDAVAAVSDVLVQHIAKLGREATLLTHGLDLRHWKPACPSSAAQADHSIQAQPVANAAASAGLPDWFAGLSQPIILFWGLLDRRLDVGWCRALVRDTRFRGTLVLVGPQQAVDPELDALSPADDRGPARVLRPGPVGYDGLPALAQAADVLVMPYQDMPATQAMQPLKFKEYLGTGKPVVARALPATQPWQDAADLVDQAGDFVDLVLQRSQGGLPANQASARCRLEQETWQQKAAVLESLLDA